MSPGPCRAWLSPGTGRFRKEKRKKGGRRRSARRDSYYGEPARQGPPAIAGKGLAPRIREMTEGVRDR